MVAGFEAGDMLLAIEMLMRQRLEGRAEVEIQYTRGVNEAGNPEAQAIMKEVFEECAANRIHACSVSTRRRKPSQVVEQIFSTTGRADTTREKSGIRLAGFAP